MGLGNQAFCGELQTEALGISPLKIFKAMAWDGAVTVFWKYCEAPRGSLTL